MASLYSVIPGLVPTAQEIIEAELLAKQVLEGKFPDLDLREGTGLRDLVLRPTAYAFALLRKANDYYFTQNTLQGVDEATPSDTVDDILSNWFLTRSLGTYAVINARLYFARQKNITVTTDISFSPDNNLQYYPEEGKVYPAEAMTYDSYSNEWYLDVFLRAAATGSQYNVAEGSLLYFTNFDPYFLRGEINYLAEESIPTETNAQFIQRASTAISTRNLINVPSIEARIRSVFNYVNRVVTVGGGDPDLIRDMIRVVFDKSTPYVPTDAMIQGGRVTFEIGSDVFLPGQNVDLVGGSPSVLNGRFTIVDTGPGTITVEVPGNLEFITQVPSISLALSPLFVHNAGMTDLYCGDRLATTIVQATTNGLGVARIEGAVYALSRSEASGGSEEDTVPLFKSAVPNAYTVDYPGKTLSLTSPSHGFEAAETVEVLGLTQSVAISSIACSGLTVTLSAAGHGAQVGSTIAVSGVTPPSYNGSFTVTAVSGSQVQYNVPFQIPLSGSGADMQLANPALAEGAFVLSATQNTLQVRLPSLWATGALSGNLEVRRPIEFSVSNPYVRPLVNSAVTVRNGIATVLLFNHGYSLGRRITVKNSPVAALNGSWRITQTASGSEFQFEVPALASTALVQTTGDLQYVDHRYDYGFSSRQVLEVDFGQTYANKTASFQLSTFRDVESIQNYLDSPDNRVLCGDYLARGFNLHLLDVGVTSYNTTPANTSLLQRTVDTYLASLQPGATLVLSDLTKALGDAGITNIKTPVSVKYTRYTRDLTPPETGTIVDYLDPLDKTNVFVLSSVSSDSENV